MDSWLWAVGVFFCLIGAMLLKKALDVFWYPREQIWVWPGVGATALLIVQGTVLILTGEWLWNL